MKHVTVMYLIFIRIHIVGIPTKELHNSDFGEASFFINLSQDSILRAFARLNRTGWNLKPCLRKIPMSEHQKLIAPGYVGKDFLHSRRHLASNDPVWVSTEIWVQDYVLA